MMSDTEIAMMHGVLTALTNPKNKNLVLKPRVTYSEKPNNNNNTVVNSAEKSVKEDSSI